LDLENGENSKRGIWQSYIMGISSSGLVIQA